MKEQDIKKIVLETISELIESLPYEPEVEPVLVSLRCGINKWLSHLDGRQEEPKIWEIWSEGYVITGDSGNAHKHGEMQGKTFKDACIKFFEIKHDCNFDVERMTYWGCRLFDNEQEARKSYG